MNLSAGRCMGDLMQRRQFLAGLLATTAAVWLGIPSMGRRIWRWGVVAEMSALHGRLQPFDRTELYADHDLAG